MMETTILKFNTTTATAQQLLHCDPIPDWERARVESTAWFIFKIGSRCVQLRSHTVLGTSRVESTVHGLSSRFGSRCVQAAGAGCGDRRTGFTIFRVLRRLWIPLVVLLVIGAGGLTVSRLHGIFGSEKRPSYADSNIKDTKPFNPKHLTYEVFGPPGTVADISYFDINGDPRPIKGADLPWSVKFAFTEAAAVGSVVAQGDSDSIGCRIMVDGEVKAERISNETNAFTFCLLKSA
jgi:Mycobacterium membrane protein